MEVSLDRSIEKPTDPTGLVLASEAGRRSMQPENAIHRFCRFDEAGMRDREGHPRAISARLEFQKTLQFREIWAEVVVLTDVGLQRQAQEIKFLS